MKRKTGEKSVFENRTYFRNFKQELMNFLDSEKDTKDFMEIFTTLEQSRKSRLNNEGLTWDQIRYIINDVIDDRKVAMESDR